MTLFGRSAQQPASEGSPISGTIRVDRRTKNITKRLAPGDIAVIDHQDLDQVSAQALVACRPAAVVNAGASISGAYPNLGPQILVEAGIPLVDRAGSEAMTALAEGQTAQLRGSELWVDGALVIAGHLLDPEAVQAATDLARRRVGAQIEAFARNTMEYVRVEQDLLLDGIEIPVLRTRLQDRYALVVVRGYHYKEDLQTLRFFIREADPVLIGVDGGADALIELGHRPDLIVGDMDSVSDTALTSGAEIVVHAYGDGHAPGLDRVRELGVVDPVVLSATGTSEDIALLLADGSGASLIVAVGSHATLVEFLDKGRKGMASTFLTRLRIGSKLVDAKGVSLLYRSRISIPSLLWLVLAGLVALVTAIAVTPGGRALMGVLAVRVGDLWAFLLGLVG